MLRPVFVEENSAISAKLDSAFWVMSCQDPAAACKLKQAGKTGFPGQILAVWLQSADWPTSWPERHLPVLYKGLTKQKGSHSKLCDCGLSYKESLLDIVTSQGP